MMSTNPHHDNGMVDVDTDCPHCGYVLFFDAAGMTMLNGRSFWSAKAAMRTWRSEVEDIADDDAREYMAKLPVRAIWRQCPSCAN